MRKGGGGKFAKGVSDMTKKGMPKSEAAAIMAKQGRKKYGSAEMEKMAATGRKRASKGGK